MAKVVQRVMGTRENDWTDAVPFPAVVVDGTMVVDVMLLVVVVMLLIDTSFAVVVAGSVFPVAVEAGGVVGSVMLVPPVGCTIINFEKRSAGTFLFGLNSRYCFSIVDLR